MHQGEIVRGLYERMHKVQVVEWSTLLRLITV